MKYQAQCHDAYALAEYVEKIFIPAMKSKGAGYQQGYRKAARYVAEYAGRDIEVAAIQGALLDAFRHWLIDNKGLAPTTAENCFYKVRRIAEHATRSPGQPGDIDRGELGEWFEESFAPQRLTGLTKDTWRRYRRTIDVFGGFLRRPPKLSDLAPFQLKDFDAWCRTFFNPSIRPDTKNIHYVSILSLARHAHSSLFPERRGSGLHKPVARDHALLALPERSLLRYLFEHYLPSRDVSPRYACDAAKYVKVFDNWSGGATVDDLTGELLGQYVDHLEAKGCSRKTITNNRGLLLSLWRHAHDQYATDRKPEAVRMPSKDIPERQTGWKPEQVARLLRECQKLTGWIRDGVKRGDYFDCVIRIGWDSSLRLGDIFKLDAESILPDGRLLVVLEKEARPHTAYVHPSTLATIRRIAPDGDEHPLAWPFGVKAFRAQFHALVKAARLVGSFTTLRSSSDAQCRQTRSQMPPELPTVDELKGGAK
ncbi:MAG: phage integrase SAM-like domain-containing protein [Pirellulales bacterium]